VSPEVALGIITPRYSAQTSLSATSPSKTKASNQHVSKRNKKFRNLYKFIAFYCDAIVKPFSNLG
jgi:hypothetical protein